MITVPRRYRHVVQDRDRHGNLRTYLRLPGRPKVRLHEAPGTDAFGAEYRRALDAKPEAPRKAVEAPARGTPFAWPTTAAPHSGVWSRAPATSAG